MRLIDAHALEKAILSERYAIPETIPCAPYELCETKPNRDGQLIRGGLRKALRCLNDAPTVDVVEVRHGEWIPSCHRGCFFMCSVCKSGDEEHQPFYENTWQYCPNCGAKMDGGKNDDK